MKLLIDNNLSPRLSLLLKQQGHDAKHVGENGMFNASDIEIFRLAFNEERLIVTADTDFSFILSQWNQNSPSLILLRYFPYNPEIQSLTISRILSSYQQEIIFGSIIIVESDRIRIRALPIHK